MSNGFIILAAVLVAALLVACFVGRGQPNVQSGVVVEKLHYDAYFWIQMLDVGNNTLIPITHDEPEQWTLVVEGIDEDDRRANRVKRRKVSVCRATYDAHHVGDHVNVKHLE